MPALAEAKLWAAREVWRTEKKSEHGLQTFAAKLVTKSGTGDHPTQRAVGLFYAKVDADPEWFPGKMYRKKSGPERALSGQQVSAIARLCNDNCSGNASEGRSKSENPRKAENISSDTRYHRQTHTRTQPEEEEDEEEEDEEYTTDARHYKMSKN
jgi:hypothetical protein